MNETSTVLAAFISGLVLGWIACGISVKEDCAKIGGFVAGSAAYVCEVKK